MTFWERMTRTRTAKACWWLTAAAALLFGAFFCAVAIISWKVGCYTPNTGSYWDTTNAADRVDNAARAVFNDIIESEWTLEEPRFFNQEEVDRTSIRFHFSALDKGGKTLYSTKSGDDLRLVYRIYFDIRKDGGYENYRWEYAAGTLTGNYVDSRADANAVITQNTPQPIYTGSALLEIYVDEAMLAPNMLDRSELYWSEERLLLEFFLFQHLDAAAEMFPLGILLCGVLGLLSLVMLAVGAGRKPGRAEVSLCWFDHVPMELQVVVLVLLGSGMWALAYFGMEYVNRYILEPRAYVNVILGRLLPFVCTMIEVFGLLVLVSLYSVLRWGKTGHPLHCCWTLRVCSKVLGWVWKLVRDTLCAIPIAPQAAAALLIVFGLTFFFLVNSVWDGGIWLVLWLLLWAATAVLVMHIALSLNSLQSTLKAFMAGNYDAKPKMKSYIPALHAMADDLSHVGDGMNAAVEQRMKSERLKTELITNVSHDLKTPLTSIINYTDLLRKEELPEKAAEYAEVLARQGEKLRKLTEDLVEASKATSGVLSCTKVPTDLAELCEQAVAEYSDRLEAAGLVPVLDLPQNDFTAQLDGRLTWRVLDNLLSNACKYAQPGTRLYLTGAKQADELVLVVKNISREALNVAPDELMERFVRGDSARSTEGSGLGLSIARSLTELQGGSFAIRIDGDLFKAEIRFPIT